DSALFGNRRFRSCSARRLLRTRSTRKSRLRRLRNQRAAHDDRRVRVCVGAAATCTSKRKAIRGRLRARGGQGGPSHVTQLSSQPSRSRQRVLAPRSQEDSRSWLWGGRCYYCSL